MQVDEIWGFVGAKSKNADSELKAAGQAGDTWLWVATDADTKLVPSWFVGGRDSDSAIVFMDDLAKRLTNRIQLTSDGHKAYLEAVEGAFGSDIDYAMVVRFMVPRRSQRRVDIAPPIARASSSTGSKATPIPSMSALRMPSVTTSTSVCTPAA